MTTFAEPDQEASGAYWPLEAGKNVIGPARAGRYKRAVTLTARPGAGLYPEQER
ncbi:MAG: hypothetical protein GVY31_02600 [Alphaproteobacteria bacterium]|jgi:hypothetical protein|nr:hypothetical protein [Alphaproteobacteria bacterium]